MIVRICRTVSEVSVNDIDVPTNEKGLIVGETDNEYSVSFSRDINDGFPINVSKASIEILGLS
jgi:hypothetical protein